jgi:hypothetical protein
MGAARLRIPLTLLARILCGAAAPTKALPMDLEVIGLARAVQGAGDGYLELDAASAEWPDISAAMHLIEAVPGPEPQAKSANQAPVPEAASVVDPDWQATMAIVEPTADRTYRGEAKVTVLPPGVSGEEMNAARQQKIAPGSIWRRGRQRVRVEKLTTHRSRRGGRSVRVHFTELSWGKGKRILSRGKFLKTSWPEIGARSRSEA